MAFSLKLLLNHLLDLQGFHEKEIQDHAIRQPKLRPTLILTICIMQTSVNEGSSNFSSPSLAAEHVGREKGFEYRKWKNRRKLRNVLGASNTRFSVSSKLILRCETLDWHKQVRWHAF